MACCSSLDYKEYWIWLLSFFYAIIAIILIVFGMVTLESTGEVLKTVELQAPSLAVAIVGLLLLLEAFIGIFTGCKVYNNAKGKSVLYPAAIFVAGSFLLNIVMLGAGIAMLRYRRFLDQVVDNDFNSIGERILMYELAVFEECCSPEAVQPELCDANGGIFPCIPDADIYSYFIDFIGDGTCAYFEKSGLTSATDPESCGEQTLLGFIPAISGYLYAQLTILGVINLVLSLVLLVITAAIAKSLHNLTDYESSRETKVERPDKLPLNNDFNFDDIREEEDSTK